MPEDTTITNETAPTDSAPEAPATSVDLETDVTGEQSSLSEVEAIEGDGEPTLSTVSEDRDDLRAALRAQRRGVTPEQTKIDDTFNGTIEHFKTNFDDETAKAVEPIVKELSELRQWRAQQEQQVAAQRELSLIDAAISEHGLEGYGDGKSRTPADYEALQDLRDAAVTIRDRLAARGKNISDSEAIRRAHLALSDGPSEPKQVSRAIETLGKRHAARTVVTGKGKATVPENPAFAHLDKTDPQFEARKAAIEYAAKQR
jgi:hypothetical protein